MIPHTYIKVLSKWVVNTAHNLTQCPYNSSKAIGHQLCFASCDLVPELAGKLIPQAATKHYLPLNKSS